jgi:hypothetical protein
MTMAERKTIDDLRDHLFATLEAVKTGGFDLDRARAINELGKTIIDSAKVEVDYLRVTNGGESEFLASTVGAGNLPPGLPNGIAGVVRHRLKG